MADLTKYNGGHVNTAIRKSFSDNKEAKSFLMCGNEFLTQPNPINWLIKGILQKKSLAMIHEPSGRGMDSVVLDWVLHLVSGVEEWQGMKVRPCDVVYLNGEGHHGMYSRVSAWTAANPTYKPGNIYFSEDWTDADNQIQTIQVIKEIKLTKLKPGLIVIDMLSHFYHSVDGTVTQATRKFLRSCVALQREFGCTILLVHTTGVYLNLREFKQGYSNCKGMLDQEFGVSPFGKDELTLTQLKLRDGVKKAPMRLKLKTVTIPGWFDEDGEPISSVVLEKFDSNPTYGSATYESTSEEDSNE